MCTNIKSKLRKTILLAVAGSGLLVFWIGMFYGFYNPESIHFEGLVAAFSGLFLVVAAHPICKALMDERNA